MKVLYSRVSTIDQKLDRQQVDVKKYDFSITDKCSGAIAFFERPGGREILQLVNKKAVTSLFIENIDRLGRDIQNILETVAFFNTNKIPITFTSNGLTTLNDNGQINFITEMCISFLATVAQMEKQLSRERMLQGIAVAKANKLYLGRKTGTKEDTLKFLSKPKNKKALGYMKSNKSLSLKEISTLAGVHVNTLTKIKKLGLQYAA